MTTLATLARVYVDDLDVALPTFVALTGEQPRQRISYRDLEIAGIGGFLLIAGTEEALAPYRGTHATVVVSSLDEVAPGETLDGPNTVPTGRNMTVRHPGGATIEYLEFASAARPAEEPASAERASL
ncbi:hypothetical protein DN069_20720 [Streptacidiphilus pinicola]|uniref:VOC family protein n=1 Tax=Streptacidiphilus pinicola TaxID=2219663 RepID=A0A2X0IF93_9ACTN|nr:hypothetical protein [Streptacidiphilus pinicola]RAG83722.1 hypothetical protein DN069_20720 [Streptacidiphilus pinicola]